MPPHLSKYHKGSESYRVEKKWRAEGGSGVRDEDCSFAKPGVAVANGSLHEFYSLCKVTVGTGL